jgi:hypothetical protein
LAGSKVIGNRSLLGSGQPRGFRRPVQKVGGRSPSPFGQVSVAPWAAKTDEATDFRSFNNFKFPCQRRAMSNLYYAMLSKIVPPPSPHHTSTLKLLPVTACRRRRRKCDTLCYTIARPGRRSAFRAGVWQQCYQESSEIGPPAGLRPVVWPISGPSKSGHTPTRNSDFTARKHNCVT